MDALTLKKFAEYALAASAGGRSIRLDFDTAGIIVFGRRSINGDGVAASVHRVSWQEIVNAGDVPLYAALERVNRQLDTAGD